MCTAAPARTVPKERRIHPGKRRLGFRQSAESILSLQSASSRFIYKASNLLRAPLLLPLHFLISLPPVVSFSIQFPAGDEHGQTVLGGSRYGVDFDWGMLGAERTLRRGDSQRPRH